MEETLDLKLPYFLVPDSAGNHTVQTGSGRLRVGLLLEAGELSRDAKQMSRSIC